jgi:hypothetical protein
MRIDAKTLGVGAGLTIIGILIGFFAHRCPLDGNPVGFKLSGNVVLSDSGFKASCGTRTCTLHFDIRTSEAAAVTNVAQCRSSNCFHFKDDGTGKWPLDMTDAGGPHPTYHDYVDGTVEVEP